MLLSLLWEFGLNSGAGPFKWGPQAGLSQGIRRLDDGQIPGQNTEIYN